MYLMVVNCCVIPNLQWSEASVVKKKKKTWRTLSSGILIMTLAYNIHKADLLASALHRGISPWLTCLMAWWHRIWKGGDGRVVGSRGVWNLLINVTCLWSRQKTQMTSESGGATGAGVGQYLIMLCWRLAWGFNPSAKNKDVTGVDDWMRAKRKHSQTPPSHFFPLCVIKPLFQILSAPFLNHTIFTFTLSSSRFSPAMEKHVSTRPGLSCQFAPGLWWVSSGPSLPYRWLRRHPPGDVLFGVCTEANLIKGGHISSSPSFSQSLSFWDMGAHQTFLHLERHQWLSWDRL